MPQLLDWDEASQRAQLAGGTLASITSSDESAFVYALVDAPQFWVMESGPGSGNLGPWLGGHQPPGSVEPAGGWEWVTGENFPQYENWQLDPQLLPLQPNNAPAFGFTHEDRLHYIAIAPLRSAQWNDISGQRRTAAYVVEWLSDPRGQANSPGASLLVNGVGNTLQPGPHVQVVAQSSSLTFQWSGPAGLPYMLALGQVAPCAVQFGCVGCLDLSSLVIVFDGTTALGQLLFVLNALGSATQTLTLPPLPAGTELGFQGLVLQPGACAAVLTAAHVVGL